MEASSNGVSSSDDDWRYDDSADELAQLSYIGFINDTEKCTKFMRALGKLRNAVDDRGTSDLNSSLKRGLSTVRRAQSASSGSVDSTPREELAAVTQAILLVGNHLKDVTALLDSGIVFPRMLTLNLSFNSLRDIPDLTCCPSLRTLDLSHNKLSQIDFVSSLVDLATFRCHYNAIESLLPLQPLTALEELWVSNNKIEFAQFLNLNACSQLSVLVKNNNPCDDKPKFNDFLYNILGTLSIIDGQSVDSLIATGQLSNKSSEDSVDVKVMMTRARAQLQRDASAQNLLSVDMINSPDAGFERLRSTTATARNRKNGVPIPRNKSAHRPPPVSTGPGEEDSSPSGEGVATPVQRHRQNVLRHKSEKQMLATSDADLGGAGGVDGLQLNVSRKAMSSKGKAPPRSDAASMKTLNELNSDLDHVLGDIHEMRDRPK